MKNNASALLFFMKSFLSSYKESDLHYSPFSKTETVSTFPLDSAQYANGILIRSYDSVKVEKNQIEYTLLKKLIMAAYEKPSDYIKEYRSHIYIIQNEILKTINALIAEIRNIEIALYIIIDSVGYKTDIEPNPFVKVNDIDYSEYIISKYIKDLLFKYLSLNNINEIDSFMSLDLTSWSRYYKRVLNNLKCKNEYKYEIAFYINAPICERDEIVKLGNMKYGIKNYEIFAQHVTDTELSNISFDIREDTILRSINTKIFYYQTIPIKAKQSEFESLYQDAESLAKMILTNLRLIYDFEIGIFNIHINPLEKPQPMIRNSGSLEFNEQYSAFLPKRFIFATHSFSFFSDKKKKALFIKTNSQNVTFKGIDVALRRLNTCIENYFPSDLHRLLDIAIAFEAIYLNDSDSNKELSYRLSLRTAKFLRKSLSDKKMIFDCIRDLYDYRSKLAHGDNLASFKEKDRIRLLEINVIAPELLRESILKIYKYKKVTEWNDFWKDLSLQ